VDENGKPGGGGAPGETADAQQIAAVSHVAAGVAQEIAAPLTAISMTVEFLLRSGVEEDSPIRGDLETILAQTQRISRMARSLMELARPGAPVFAPVDLDAVVSGGFEVMMRQLRRAGVEVVAELEPELSPVRGDLHQLQQVLIDVLLHAERTLRALPEGPRRVVVATRRATDSAEMLVRDSGPGIAGEDLARVLLPFFPGPGGSGLGLAVARGIVHRHGGTLRVEGGSGGGSTFVVRLPLWRDGDGG
jgi:signal transduction histidine kinase